MKKISFTYYFEIAQNEVSILQVSVSNASSFWDDDYRRHFNVAYALLRLLYSFCDNTDKLNRVNHLASSYNDIRADYSRKYQLWVNSDSVTSDDLPF